MKFTKMHGLGNDYVYIDCFEQKVEEPEVLAVQMSRQHFGIGADGLILIEPSDRADCKMRIFNADGSEAEMCGNGIRCIGKYVYENKIVEKPEIFVETKAGIKKLTLFLENGEVKQIQVAMGEPIWDAQKIPIHMKQSPVHFCPITIGSATFIMHAVSIGNPHGIIFQQYLEDEVVQIYGPLLERHPIFPKHANIEFVKVIDSKHIQVRVWERGSGETLACGTGACAAAVVAASCGYTGREVEVNLPGGTLAIEWRESDNCIYMTGSADIVFEGNYFITL